MIVIALTSVSEKTKGYVSRYLMEVSTGVFIGRINARTRDELWKFIEEYLGRGKAVMAYSTNNAQGFEIKMCGFSSREVVDFDGISLIRKIDISNLETKNIDGPTGWSNAYRFHKYQNIRSSK